MLCLPGTATIDLILLQAGQQYPPYQVVWESCTVLCMHCLAAADFAHSACHGGSTTMVQPEDELLLLCFGTSMMWPLL